MKCKNKGIIVNVKKLLIMTIGNPYQEMTTPETVMLHKMKKKVKIGK
jgi:hypothetical protein